MSFDHADFLAHPKKYEMYKTAKIATHVFTNDGRHDLPAGEIVGVQYRTTAYCSTRRRYEPVYTVTLQDNSVWGDMYAAHLTRFVL